MKILNNVLNLVIVIKIWNFAEIIFKDSSNVSSYEAFSRYITKLVLNKKIRIKICNSQTWENDWLSRQNDN